MKKIAFAGTFDPITNGHLWVIQEGLNIAEKVLVIIAVNSSKKSMFSDALRKTMIEESVKSIPGHENIEVILMKNEYVSQSAIEQGCDYLIRGIRSAVDFDYETLIQKTNTDILYGAKTLFVMPPRDLESVSSSFVKSLVGPVGWHWYIKDFVSPYVYNCWIEKYLKDFCQTLFKDEKVIDFIEFIKPYYNQKERKYHDLSHIAHCMQELEWAIANHKIDISDAKKVCLALLGHDVIYGEKNKDKSDEELSALLTSQWMKDNIFLSFNSDIVSSLIEKTQYLSNKKITLNNDLEKLMCSIDLAILGQHKNIYENYTKTIRQEYMQYTDEEYKAGRIAALTKLKQIPQIYQAKEFFHYEKRAKINLDWELSQLSN